MQVSTRNTAIYQQIVKAMRKSVPKTNVRQRRKSNCAKSPLRQGNPLSDNQVHPYSEHNTCQNQRALSEKGEFYKREKGNYLTDTSLNSSVTNTTLIQSAVR